MDYKNAGVDIEAGYKSVELMKKHIKTTMRPEVLGGIGGFAGAFSLAKIKEMKEPVLLSGTDGCGTKVQLAYIMDKHDTIGIDAVAMCVNDIACSGGEPLFFLDYIACGKNYPEKIATIVSGVAEGCNQSGAALVGGETAEHPGLMPENEYDLAGFAVGVVEKDELITGENIKAGDTLIGIASSGVHSNGFSLVRKIIEVANPDLNADLDGRSLADALMAPTRIYVKPLLALMDSMQVKGMAHITGGGLVENIPRVLQKHLTAVLKKEAWPMPPLFSWLQKHGNVADSEMHRVFNCGIGMVVIVSRENADAAMAQLKSAGETVYRIGEIRQRTGDEPQTIVE